MKGSLAGTEDNRSSVEIHSETPLLGVFKFTLISFNFFDLVLYAGTFR